jgi:hypothetical protein
LVLVYVWIYCATNVLDAIPGVGAAAGVAALAQRGVVTAIGRIWGVEFDFQPTGSGDTEYAYAAAAFDALMAAIGATVWHAVRRAGPVAPRTADVTRIMVRYGLAAVMLGYGFIKVIPVQMPAPGPDRLLNTIGDTSPMGLLWTLMGASAAYQIFSGASEALGSILLFWRRTTLLGALVLTGVLTNVVALNLCYDVPVKLFSAHLLGMALYLVAPHAPRLLDVLWFNRAAAPMELRPFPIGRRWLRWSAYAVKALVVVSCVGAPLSNAYDSAYTYGFMAPRSELDGVYRVTAFTRAGATGSAVADASRWVRIGINGRVGLASLQRADGSTRRYRVTIDGAKHTVTIRTMGEEPVTLTYAKPAVGTLRFEGSFESTPIAVDLARQPDAAVVLTSRPFRWISPFPYNR